MFTVYVSNGVGKHIYYFETWREVEAFETALDELCNDVTWETKWQEIRRGKIGKEKPTCPTT